MGAYLALAGVQAAGGFFQADLIRQNGNLQQKIAGMNEQYAEVDADNALKAGYGQAAKQYGEGKQIIAAQDAGEAGAGVTIGYGTAAAVSANSILTSKLNSLAIQRQANETAMGYQTQALNIQVGGEMAQLQAQEQSAQAIGTGLTSAATTTLSGYAATTQSTGKGVTSKTGTSDKPIWRVASTNVDIDPSQTNLGDGSVKTAYGNGYNWYNDGYFGSSPRGSGSQISEVS